MFLSVIPIVQSDVEDSWSGILIWKNGNTGIKKPKTKFLSEYYFTSNFTKCFEGSHALSQSNEGSSVFIVLMG